MNQNQAQIQNQGQNQDQNPEPVQANQNQVDQNQIEQGPPGGAIAEWNQEAMDQPQEFPELGFPDEPPITPTQPEFQYRYRIVGSTPRSRRLDFDRSIVLRPCQRDRFTGKIPDNEYTEREESEMKLSLGCVGYTILYGPYISNNISVLWVIISGS